MTMQDAQKQEDSRSMFKEKSSKKGMNEMANDRFLFRGSSHGSGFGSEDRATFEWWKYLPH
jgi:hypothetical protein